MSKIEFVAEKIVKAENAQAELEKVTADTAETLADTLTACGELFGQFGAEAELARQTGKSAKTIGLYVIAGRVWANDLDPSDTALVFKRDLNSAVCHEKIIGMTELRKIIKESAPTVAELMAELAKRRNAKPKKEGKKTALIEVVLRALPNLTPAELAQVAASVASLTTTQATELVNA
jgi:hypothetical protein